jgi:predicted PurR-regulated permease PerM
MARPMISETPSTPSPSAPAQASPFDWSITQIILGTLVVLLVVLAFWVFIYLRLSFFSLFIAITISTAIKPAVDWLVGRGLSRAASVSLVYLGGLALVTGLIWATAPILIEQAINIAQSGSGYYQALREQLAGSSIPFLGRIAAGLPQVITLTTPPSTDDLLAGLAQVLSYSGVVGNGLFMLVAIFLLAFFWTLEGDRTVRSWLLTLRSDRRATVQEIISQIETKVGAYIRGLAFLSLAVGLLAVGGYSAIGLPHALLLGIIAGLFEALPIIGPLLGMIPAVIIALSNDPLQAVWVIGINVVIQMVENTFLVPRVMNKAVGMNPIAIILAVTAFSSLFGLPGALLAIPLAATLHLLLNRFVLDLQRIEQKAPEGRGSLSLVRYETQEFVHDVRKQIRRKPSLTNADTDQVEETLETIAQDLDSILARAAAETGTGEPS